MTQTTASTTDQTTASLLAELAALRAQNQALRSASERSLKLKVSLKGALSVYGLGRFPVTLYREQWAKLLGAESVITAFIAAHSAELKLKGESLLTFVTPDDTDEPTPDAE